MTYKSLIITGLACTLLTISNAQSITWIATDQFYTWGTAISPDGSVVVGYGNLMNPKPFRWTQSSGAVNFYPQSTWARANDVSANGDVIVGIGASRPFRWNNGHLQILYEGEGEATGVSADGSTVVGWYRSSIEGEQRAFRWTSSGFQDLGTLGGQSARAYGVSSDGQVVVGEAYDADPCCPTYLAFRWDPIHGMQSLGFTRESAAYDVSSDGSVVVGTAGQPFRWNMGTVTNLTSMPGVATAVSGNGSIVVGSYTDPDRREVAFRWTTTCGFENLNQVYAHLLNGSRLEYASDISADGRYIVGWGYNATTRRREAFLLDTTPPNCCTEHNGDVDSSGCVDDADLLLVLFNFGVSGSNLGRVDINCDGTVDDADLLIVLFNFGVGC